MSLKNLTRTLLVLLAMVFLAPTPAHANVVIPMIFVTLPAMIVALLPIIAIESYVLWSLIGASAWYSVWVVSVANVASTLIGVPVTWVLLLPLAIFPSEMAPGVIWVLFYEGAKEPKRWVFAAGSFLLLISFFYVSWFIEYQIAIRMLDGFESQNVKFGVLVGNLVTYGTLAAIVLGWLVWEVLRASPPGHPSPGDFLSWSRAVRERQESERAEQERGQVMENGDYVAEPQLLSHARMEPEVEEGEKLNGDDDGQTLPSEAMSPAGKFGLVAKQGYNGTGLTDAEEVEEHVHEGALVK